MVNPTDNAYQHLLVTVYQHLADKDIISPSDALKLLIEYCRCKHLESGYCGAFLNVPDTPHGNLPTSVGVLLDQHAGIIQPGPLGLDVAKGRKAHQVTPFDKDSKILINWPALIRNADVLVYLNPVLALFLLTFSKVIEQHSPFVLESLQRKWAKDVRGLSQSFDVQGNSIYPYKGAPIPAYAVEEDILHKMLYKLSRERGSFFTMLTNACAEQYYGKPRSAEYRSINRTYRGAKAGCVPRNSRDVCSIIQLDGSRSAPLVSVEISPDPSYLKRHPCRGLTPILRELWVAYHMATRWKSVPGVESIPLGASDGIVRKLGITLNPDNDALVINWGLWFAYRASLRYYEPYIRLVQCTNKSLGYIAPKAATVQTKPSIHLSSAFEAHYPGSYLPSEVLSEKFASQLGSAWAIDSDDLSTKITVVSIEGLLRASIIRNTSMYKKPRLKAVRSSGHVKYSVEPLYFDFTIDEGGEVLYTCRAIHLGGGTRKIYFQPSWYIPPLAYFYDVNISNEYLLWHPDNLLSGVTVLPDGGGPAFDFKRLIDTGTVPLHGSIHIRLTELSRLSRAKFKQSISGNRSTYRYTAKEDEAIIKYYRPDRTPEEHTAMMMVCNTRTVELISGRARTLRRELINKRIYDINKLPHGQFNHHIGKEIAKAKKRFGDD